METRNKIVAAVFILLEKDGKFLFLRRFNTGYQDGNYDLPAGHIDEGELPTETAIREAKEEVNVDLKSEDLQLVHVIYKPKHDPTGDRINFLFRAKKWSGEVKNLEPEKCDGLGWFALDELPKNTITEIPFVLENVSKGIFFSEVTIDWLKEKGLYNL